MTRRDTETIERDRTTINVPAFATADAAGYLLSVSDNLCRITGRSEAELLRLRLGDIMCCDVAAEVKLDDVIRGKRTGFETHTHITRTNGTLVPVRADLTAVRRQGEFVCLHVLARPDAEEDACATEARRCRAVVDAVRGVLWTNNAAGEMWGEQPGWATLTGQSFEEYQGFGWKNALHPDDVGPTVDAWRAAVAAERTFVFEHRLRLRNGQWRRYSVRAVPVFDEAGALSEWVGIHTDVTEQRAAERSWLDVAADLKKRATAADSAREKTWNNVRDMLLISDTEGVFRAANPAWTTVLGWTPEDLIGSSFRDFLHPEDKAASGGEAPFVNGKSKGFEARLRHKNGTYRWTSWLMAPEGDLIYANGRDITAEKEVAEALERSEAQMRAIFHTSYQSKCISALDGTVLDANPTSLASVGADLADVVGRPLWETPWFSGTPEIAAFVHSSFASVVSGETVRREMLLNLPSGPYWFDFTMRPICDSRGQVVSVVSEAADITSKRQAHDALLRSQRLEAVGQITGGIAHDFNNLLTPIMGSLELVQRRATLDARLQGLVANAMQSADRARVLVQRLLAFARRQHLDARDVDLQALVFGMRELIDRSLGAHIALHVDIPDGLPPAKVDPGQLEIALLNLAFNGRDAMPDGGTITVSASEEWIEEGTGSGLEPGCYVKLSFYDTGVGMARETLARAVEPFFSTKSIGMGTGLGLSMIDGLAAQSGGKLDLESEAGRGTRATLWLPVAEARATPNLEALRPTSCTKPLAILLTDDNPLARDGAAAMLEAMGHTVKQAEDGACALGYLESGQPCDVLVTDQRMPRMTGIELVRRARALRPDLPAVLITGFANVDEPGIEELPRVSKPFRSSELASVLASVVGGANNASET